MTPCTYLAFDLGASSGRAVLGVLSEGRLGLTEVHRFRTPLVERAGRLRWDLDSLWNEVRTGLAAGLRLAPGLRSVSVDTWAVDYVPLGAQGEPLRDPYCYRDTRTWGRMAEVRRRLSDAELYARTGIQFLELNTIYQVAADLAGEPETAARTRTRLLIADYLLYRLSGRAVAERTIASTTQLLNAQTGEWDDVLIRAIGDQPERWPEVVAPGTVLAPLHHRLAAELGLRAGARPLVVATCSHDTAAAVAAVPAREDGRAWAYVSAGTWSLVGVELQQPVLSDAARRANFSNEAGLDGTTRFLKNRTGFWVLEECLRQWAERRQRTEYDTLVAEAAAAPAVHRFLDLDDPLFAARGDMLARIDAYCREHELPLPPTRGALARLILESLAEAYRLVLADLATLTGRAAGVLHVVGGGAYNRLFNQLAADACGIPVVAGPGEATAVGNLLVQARTLGDLPPGCSVRGVAGRSAELRHYSPQARATDS
jgi:rhamnulokinase